MSKQKSKIFCQHFEHMSHVFRKLFGCKNVGSGSAGGARCLASSFFTSNFPCKYGLGRFHFLAKICPRKYFVTISETIRKIFRKYPENISNILRRKYFELYFENISKTCRKYVANISTTMFRRQCFDEYFTMKIFRCKYFDEHVMSSYPLDPTLLSCGHLFPQLLLVRASSSSGPRAVTRLTVYRPPQVLLQAVLAISINRDFLVHFCARIDSCRMFGTNFC